MTGGIERVELAPGYTIPRLIVGLWQLSSGHSSRVSTEEPGRWLGRFVDAGMNTFDCADIYTGVEEELGRFVATRPTGAVQVHTKFVPDRSVLSSINARYVRTIVERSLTRLRVERLDLVQFHWWDFETPGWVDTAVWLDDLRREGKIRLLGLTNFGATQVAEIQEAGVRPAADQVQFSLLDRRPERRLAPLAAATDFRLLAYGTLAGGFLSSRWSGREPAKVWENRSLEKYALIIEDAGGWEAFQEILRAAVRVARRHEATIPSVAIRWVLDRPGVAAAVVGARDAAHLESNLAALALRLDSSDRCTMDDALAALSGPSGDVYELEREPGGRHVAIMRTELNRG